ncbi:uridine diphosphate-N-acetylglucosamine-binding protein YvcK [Frankia sp. AgB1.9]|uniref:gluconeogenesis factor YvcK family protein n=1 Tax=Frankia sp. AgB1.9 TaxID=1836968 RepID=UPI0019340AB3|nr:uridine diphosphate-N-acetylglucosamine-binding protein YvcK [Frankia sp. AgB1.9]MBL7552045.1 uridine diphosphate-N-acetylglucosamine-binding protein YvcK [Frankia sp. AgB1.9]
MPNSADHGRADDRDPAAAAAGRDGAAGWPGPVSAWADHGPAVVAFGGGHGLAASLAALRRLTDRLTAVVTVGDDGGSSGRLRAELGALPPGDLRMALAALAGPDPWSRSWTELFQRRFEGDGPLAGHAVGNLVLAALAEHVGSPVAALELAAQLLGVHGRVLPLSEDGIDIVAEVAGLDPADPAATRLVRGQVAVASTAGAVCEVWVEPAEPRACAPACAAVEAADWLILGPGSLYTSMLPHLLVPEMHKTITGAAARRLLVLNLVAQAGETEGFTPEAHLRVLARHAPGLTVDVVLADPAAVPDPAELAAAAAELGARLHLAPVRAPEAPGTHDPVLLAAAFEGVFAAYREDPFALAEAVPAEAVPAEAVPAEAVPAEAAPADVPAARANLTTDSSPTPRGPGPAAQRTSWITGLPDRLRRSGRTPGAGSAGTPGPPDPRVTARDPKE